MATLQVRGKKDRVYIVVVNGEERQLRQGEKVEVKDKKEADKLSKLKDINGQLLFHFIGGVLSGENAQGSKSI